MVKGKGQVEVLKVAKIRPRLLGMADAAKYLGLAYSTLKNKRSNGSFPVAPRIQGGKPYWDIEELDEYIDSLPR